MISVHHVKEGIAKQLSSWQLQSMAEAVHILATRKQRASELTFKGHDPLLMTHSQQLDLPS